MKIETNLKAGNALNDVANLSCKGLNYSANFVNQAEQQASKLASSLSNGAQSVWNTAVGWLDRV